METTPSQLDINTRNARLELKSKRIELNLHTELPRIEIDQHDCFSSAGLKSVFELTREQAQRGMQQVLEFIGKTASDGRLLAAIEKGKNAIAEIAKRDSYHMHEFGIAVMPSARPKITVKGSLSFNPDKINDEGIRNNVRATFIPGDVSISYTPSRLNIFMKQYGSISIRYYDSRIDARI